MSGHQNRLDIRVGIEIDLISVMGSKLTWFEVDVVLALRSNLTSFLCGGQDRLRFSFWAENFLVIIYRSKLTWFLAWGSKLTWSSSAGRKSRFNLSVGID